MIRGLIVLTATVIWIVGATANLASAAKRAGP
jgi:hypothetical protein